MKTLLIVIASALALCACVAVGSAAPPSLSPANPTVRAGPGFDAVVTEKDLAISIRVGQKLEAVLRARSGMTAWGNVTSSNTSILMPVVDTGASAARGVTLAGFQAVAPGHSQITATAGADCPSGQPCPMYAMVLSIDVTVTSG